MRVRGPLCPLHPNIRHPDQVSAAPSGSNFADASRASHRNLIVVVPHASAEAVPSATLHHCNIFSMSHQFHKEVLNPISEPVVSQRGTRRGIKYVMKKSKVARVSELATPSANTSSRSTTPAVILSAGLEANISYEAHEMPTPSSKQRFVSCLRCPRHSSAEFGMTIT